MQNARQHATTSGASAPSAKNTPPDQAPTPTSRPGALHGEANSPVRVPSNRVPYSNHPYVHRLVLRLLQIHALSLQGILQLPSLSLPIAKYLQQAPDARQHATTSTVSAAEVSITPPDQAPSPTSQQGAPPLESNSQVRVPATQHRPPCVRT